MIEKQSEYFLIQMKYDTTYRFAETKLQDEKMRKNGRYKKPLNNLRTNFSKPVVKTTNTSLQQKLNRVTCFLLLNWLDMS